MDAPVWVNLPDPAADLDTYRPTPRRPVPPAGTRAVEERRRRPPPAFRLFAIAALATLPLVAAAYWALLYRLHRALPRILDPNGPTVSLPPPVKPGFDQLKQVLQPQDW